VSPSVHAVPLPPPAGERPALPPLRGVAAPRSVYVHVPFCRHRCDYCAFSVARAPAPPVEAWLDAVRRELELWFEVAGWTDRIELDTIYVGGGTPSLLGCAGMERLAVLLGERFRWDPATVEWTAEANPTSLHVDVARKWRDVGVNRLSLGVQAFDDEVLAWLGREHDAAGARRAVERGRAAGFENLNVDLLFGLPEDIPRTWRREVVEARDLGVGHLSLYGLSAEPRTPLGRRVELGRTLMPGDEPYARDYLVAVDVLSDVGYVHYEVSNFARPGLECRHNWCYWDGAAYLGLGPSAHTFLPPYRIWNVFRWDAYRRAVTSVAATKAVPIGTGGGAASLREGWEEVRGHLARLERLWLGLRTRRGLSRADPAWRSAASGSGDRLARWMRAGWVCEVDDRHGRRIRLTPTGWMRMDELVTRLAGERRER